MEKFQFNKIVIAGIGLMGGSLGLAVKQAGLARQIVGLARRPRTLVEARKMRCIDEGTLSVEEAVCDADLIVLAGPVRSTPVLLQSMLPVIRHRCLITDVGSTKTEVIGQVTKLLAQARKKNKLAKQIAFVGSHPMAGSEKSGVLASQQDLYHDSTCLLIETKYCSATHIARLRRFWRAVGCSLVDVVTAREHDRLTAMVSHLPHVVAACLVNQLAATSNADRRALRVAATGFRDTTRIAAGLPAMWLDILLSNKREVGRVITDLQKRLTQFSEDLAAQKPKAVLKTLEDASRFRMKMEKHQRET